MELRHLRYFVAVAEELHFTRAAERLHIAQPPLSQQIRALEEELGVQLFERHQRAVRLTVAGERFLLRARTLLDDARLAADEARRAARGEIGELRIGFTSSLPLMSVLPATLQQFRARHPEVALHFHELFTREQFQQLRQRKLDVGVVRFNHDEDTPGLEVREVKRDRLSVVLPASHPLAARDSIAIAELAGERIIGYPAGNGNWLNTRLHSLARQNGFEWQVHQLAGEATTQIGLVAAGLGIAVLPSPLQCVQLPDIRYLPLRDADAYMTLAVAWRQHDNSPLVTALVTTLLAIGQQQNTAR
ncbi:LysR family transcriptional regulator [Vogesella oryzae]|uniref:LysR family transcriptional regulator n=1 Tax=Vogesella oryzae TaxID=1735285 RepID=UPI0015815001|nr:LysR substrate-binding domain-containing protein [Vogesella oryzae]